MVSGRERDRRASHIPTDIASEEGGYEVRAAFSNLDLLTWPSVRL